MSNYFELNESDERKAVYPIPANRQEMWKIYKVSQASFWKPEEISLQDDKSHFDLRLDERQRRLILHVLAFFAVFDSIVNTNIVGRLLAYLPMMEAKCFLGQQVSMENIHGEMYSIFVDTFSNSAEERERLLNSVEHVDSIKAMALWAENIINDEDCGLPRVLMVALMMEAVYFAGCFAIIFWFQNMGLMPGLGAANRLISRDESQHAEFICMVYNMLKEEHRMSRAEVVGFINEAVELASAFMVEAMPHPMPEMNSELIGSYIRHVANVCGARLGYGVIYEGVVNPFPWMDQINLSVKNNNHECQTVMYGKKTEQEDVAVNINDWDEVEF